MTLKDFSAQLREEFDQCHRLAMLKYKQYAHDGNPFFTLEMLGKRRNKEMVQVVLEQLDKKLVSIANMEKGEKRRSEVRDAIVYLALLDMYESQGVTCVRRDIEALPPWACADCG